MIWPNTFYWEPNDAMLSIRRAAEIKPLPQSPWGEGLLDCGLNSLWSACDWEGVADDELVLLIPALNGPAAATGQSRNPASRIAQRMADVLATQNQPLGTQHDPAIRLDDAPERLVQSGAVATYCTYRSRQARAIFESVRRLSPPAPPSVTAGYRAAWVDALCALATMDRMLYDALPAANFAPPLMAQRPMLPDVVIATLLTRLHGAYVYPETTYAHELLTASAWLGVVLSGRPAMMPEAVADVLLSYLNPRAADGSPEDARIHQTFTYCAHKLGGTERLLQAADTTRTKGPHLVHRLAFFPRKRACACQLWNVALKERVERQLTEREA